MSRKASVGYLTERTVPVEFILVSWEGQLLELITNKSVRSAAQRELRHILERQLRSQGLHKIGFRGGSPEHEIRARQKGGLHYAYAAPYDEDGKVAKHWNSFGFFEPKSGILWIVVEINIPRDADDRRIAGFFARDPATGDVYLLHSGAIGGGRPNISQRNFLRSITDQPVPVADGDRIREGLVIGRLGDPLLIKQIERFVRNVRDFKEAVAAGAVPNLLVAQPSEDEDDAAFRSEFHGWKRGTRTPVFNYFTYHGMIVDALRASVDERLVNGEWVGRDRLIDLFVKKGRQLTEVFEVKTGSGRQSLYTAIGQLLVHGGGDGVRHWLVLPYRESLPDDCKATIKALGIQVRLYRINGKGKRARIEFV